VYVSLTMLFTFVFCPGISKLRNEKYGLFLLSNTPLLSIDECKLILSSIISDEKILKIEILNKFNMINSLLNVINSSESNQYNIH